MTSEEAAYLETLGFVPSSWSASTFVLTGTGDWGQHVIRAIVERRPISHMNPDVLWVARRPGQTKTKNGQWESAVSIENKDLIALVVMAKLEEIF